MGNAWSVALSAGLLVLAPSVARPAEPTPSMLPPASAPAQPGTDGSAPAGPSASTTPPTATDATPHASNLVQFLTGGEWRAPVPAAAPCATCCDNGCCTDNCGKRQRKVARFLDWLIYRPLDGGKTKCCQICQSEPPPAWAFFPCEKGGHCGCCAVAGQRPLYYTKDAGTTATNQTVQTAYPPNTVQQAPPAPAPAPPPAPAAPQKQGGIAKAMPVLDPSQYRRMPNGN
jgi:hypothetical protein